MPDQKNCRMRCLIYHPDPTSFIEESEEYGALGKTIVALSNLEFSHDKFVFCVHKNHRDLAVRLTRNFPRQFKDKTDFLINTILQIKKLREVPFYQTGELNLLWLQYQLDEIYEIRSIIAHGSIFLSESTADRVTWQFDRYVRSEKNTYTTESVRISNGYLASVHHTASAIRHYISRLKKHLEDESSWEIEYQADKKIRENRKFIDELFNTGAIDDQNRWIRSFPPLGPVE